MKILSQKDLVRCWWKLKSTFYRYFRITFQSFKIRSTLKLLTNFVPFEKWFEVPKRSEFSSEKGPNLTFQIKSSIQNPSTPLLDTDRKLALSCNKKRYKTKLTLHAQKLVLIWKRTFILTVAFFCAALKSGPSDEKPRLKSPFPLTWVNNSDKAGFVQF